MKTDIEDEETVGLPGAVRSRISRLGKGTQVENLPFVILFFCASVDVGRF